MLPMDVCAEASAKGAYCSAPLFTPLYHSTIHNTTMLYIYTSLPILHFSTLHSVHCTSGCFAAFWRRSKNSQLTYPGKNWLQGWRWMDRDTTTSFLHGAQLPELPELFLDVSRIPLKSKHGDAKMALFSWTIIFVSLLVSAYNKLSSSFTKHNKYT